MRQSFRVRAQQYLLLFRLGYALAINTLRLHPGDQLRYLCAFCDSAARQFVHACVKADARNVAHLDRVLYRFHVKLNTAIIDSLVQRPHLLFSFA